MLFRPRLRHAGCYRLLRLLLPVVLIWTAVETYSIRQHLAKEAARPVSPLGGEKVFIASIHWNDEHVLRSHWAPAVAKLARDIGPGNVFVSIYESGSFDDTKGVLELLKADLDQSVIGHRVILDETTHKDEVERAPAESGWIQMPIQKSFRENWTEWFTLDKGAWVPRRIPYLARLRNLVMEPLYEMQKEGRKFDRVLWLNDIVFDVRLDWSENLIIDLHRAYHPLDQ